MNSDSKKIYTEIGQNIRIKRKEKHLSLSKLAEKVNVKNRQSMSTYETGKTVINLELFIKLCNELNCSADELLGNLIKINKTNIDCPNYKKLLDKNRKIIDIISCALYEQEKNYLKKL